MIFTRKTRKWAGSATGRKFIFCSYGKFHPCYRDEKCDKQPGDVKSSDQPRILSKDIIFYLKYEQGSEQGSEKFSITKFK